jgi:catechol O-methyltransferase
MTRLPLISFAVLAAACAALLFASDAHSLPSWLLWTLLIAALGLAVHELLGRPVPFLRLSVLRLMVGMKTLLRDWQVGDGREEAAARHVIARAPRGDLDAAIAAIDEFAYRHKFLINVGDEKAVILERAMDRVRPRQALELGAYVGYSALRIARMLPDDGRLVSVELNADNAAIARRVIEHAGVSDKVTVVVGQLGDQGQTIARLQAEHGFAPGTLDFVFLDHAKEAYVPDLERILAARWLHPGSIVVADNVGFPGAPEYRAYMQAAEGTRFQTDTHVTHAEYQRMIKDLVLESTLLAD